MPLKKLVQFCFFKKFNISLAIGWQIAASHLYREHLYSMYHQRPMWLILVEYINIHASKYLEHFQI